MWLHLARRRLMVIPALYRDDVALALYRKYRPKTFTEVIGQDHVTEPLMQALRSGRLNHAYLFSGPRGCGKTSSARILARSLNCAQGPTPDPCGECDSCRALAPDGPGSIDVIEIDAASHGGVDDARELRERAFFAPAISRYKIYIIDEAHMVSPAGFNALLKLVEEPPDYVKFVFATTEPEKVLGTIKSRTHHYPFRLIPPGVLRPYLEQLADSEGVKVEPQVFPLVVRAGGGSARDSLSVLDQLIAGSGAEGVTYPRAVALLGVTDVALIDEMIDALAASDGSAAFATIDSVAEAGHDARRFTGDLLQRLRDLIILRQIPEAVEKGLLDAPDDELARMRVQTGQIGEATLSRYADIVHNGLVEMRGAASPRLLLELVVARMLLPAVDDSVSALLQRVEKLERGAPVASTSPLPAGSAQASARAAAAQAASHSTANRPASTDPAPAQAAQPSPGQSPSAGQPEEATSGSAQPSAGAGAGATRGSTQRSTSAGPAGAGTTRDTSSPSALAGQPVGAGTSRDSAQSSAPAGAAAPRQSSPRAAAAESDWPEPVAAGASRTAGKAASAPAPVAAPVSAPAASSSSSSSGIDAQSVRRAWDEIVRMVGQSSKKAAAFAREAVVREIDGQTLVLVFKHKIHAEGVNNDPGPLMEAVHQVLGGVWSVRCEVGGDQRPASGATAARPKAAAAPAPAEEWPTTARAGGPAAARASAAATPQDDQVPYDPEFDGPARPAREGFDPGDEPDVDTDSLAVRQTSEEQALDSLRKSFNLEKIAENGR